MQLLTLGRLGLSGDALTRPKPLLLLAYLALEGRQSREHLVEVFFGGERGGAASLRTTLRRVRQAVPQALLTDRDTLDTAVSCDAVQFLQWLDAGELVRGTAAYTGAFLLGATLPTWTVELEEWVYRTRERLADRQRQALLDLALLDAQRAEFSAAAVYAVRSAELTDTSEPSPEQLRLLLLLLTAENVPLPPQLAPLVSRERLTVPSSSQARADLLDGHWRRREAASLPVYGTSFVGREEERAVLLRTLAMPDVRLVTLVGPGGIGKTRLAREAARMFPQRDEVAFVEVEPHMTVQHLPTALAHALHAPDPATTDPLEGVRLLLNRRSVLLVLDSAELLDGDFGGFPDCCGPVLR
ncbi:ATP-binding protein (plasmid) [Deinococcus sp. KNUC1210]|uniref:ATP-binding protein n=1 Tax=Deinococcus sp. KNUC1210 TaxID=2917691 RepID=UPI001EF13CE0|nr:ATP-binding protein [Deinococcus sp. KNUC1210]ULH17027.1 ATP-binding protein [Deinococcus sp. KNUC1210]